MYRNLIYLILLILSCLSVTEQSVKAQSPRFQELSEFVLNDYRSPDSIPLIVKHLEQNLSENPIDSLVLWAKNDFPELRDKNNYWNTDSQSLKLNLISSFKYFLQKLSLEERGKKYLEIIEQLNDSGYFSYHLYTNAYQVLSKPEMEIEFVRLISSKTPSERSSGLILGRTLAEENRVIFETYLSFLKKDENIRVRGTSIVIIGMLRGKYPKEIAFAALDILLNDTDQDMKNAAAILVKQAVSGQTWTISNVPMLLSSMLKTKNKSAMKDLGITVALLTIENKELYLDESLVKIETFEQFIALNYKHEKSLKRKLSDDELYEIWIDWWTPLIPKYTRKHEPIGIC
jgi:hypothetical protein